MYQLSGEFHCKLDAKGRLLIPSALRRLLPEKLTLKLGFEQRIELYPAEVWHEKLTKIKTKLNEFNPQHRQFLREYTSGLQTLEIDNIGRILLAKPLLERCQITTEIVIQCFDDYMEICSKAAYDEMYANLNSAAFSDLAQSILGTEGGINA